MKKTLIAAALLGASTSAMAVAPGGPGCGWGNLLFEGKSGMPFSIPTNNNIPWPIAPTVSSATTTWASRHR